MQLYSMLPRSLNSVAQSAFFITSTAAVAMYLLEELLVGQAAAKQRAFCHCTPCAQACTSRSWAVPSIGLASRAVQLDSRTSQHPSRLVSLELTDLRHPGRTLALFHGSSGGNTAADSLSRGVRAPGTHPRRSTASEIFCLRASIPSSRTADGAPEGGGAALKPPGQARQP